MLCVCAVHSSLLSHSQPQPQTRSDLMSRSIPPLHLDPFAVAGVSDPGAAPPPPALTQTLAGVYEVGGVIGVGTYGEVRYAVNVATGERVAIKIVDLARFSRETAGLMRKEIAILRLLGSHPHCIRIIQVHENVPFAGKWCESCACTRFKRRSEEKEQQEAAAAAAAGAAAGPAHPARPAHPTKRPPLVSTSPCATCSHSAAEHSGVSYQHDPSFRAHHSHGGAQPDDDDDEDDLGETRQVMLIVQELGSGGELFSLLAHSGQAHTQHDTQRTVRCCNALIRPLLLSARVRSLARGCCSSVLPTADLGHGAFAFAVHRPSRSQARKSGAQRGLSTQNCWSHTAQTRGRDERDDQMQWTVELGNLIHCQLLLPRV